MSCARTRRSVGPLRWTWQSTCSTACWSWDARTTSAWPNPGPGWGHCARIPDPCNTAERVADRLQATDQVLLPAMNAKEAMAVFDVTEADALVVVDDLETRRVVGLLSEAHLLYVTWNQPWSSV